VAPIDFSTVFERAPNPYMLLDRELCFVAANQAYLRLVGMQLEGLLGRNVFAVFPHDPDNPDNAHARVLRSSLEWVLRTGEADVLPLIAVRSRFSRFRDIRDGGVEMSSETRKSRSDPYAIPTTQSRPASLAS
jgi:PAS domain-containing protein